MLQQVPIPRVGKPKKIEPAFVLLTEPPSHGLQAILDLCSVLYPGYWDGTFADDPIERYRGWSLALFCADAAELVDDRLDLGPGKITKVAVTPRGLG